MVVRTRKAGVAAADTGPQDAPSAPKKRRKAEKKTDGPAVVNSKELCMTRFREWWSTDELSAIISQINPDIIMMFSDDNRDVFNPDRLSEILYDTVGSRFLRNIENDTTKRRLFLDLILATVTAKGLAEPDDIVGAARSAVRSAKRGSVNRITDIPALEITNNLGLALAGVLGLPPSVAEKEYVESLPDTEIIVPHTALNPLYDYQFTTGIVVRRMLEGTMVENDKEAKRKMISIPTGAGKTRMLVETIIEWLNDGKPSKNAQQRDSRFILWIAQSNELCEQAFSTFKAVFEDVGRRGTTLHMHRFWGAGGALPTLGMDDLLDEKGIIVATIQSLLKIMERPEQLRTLGRLTACVIIDEAHHAVASSYSGVLREMGFNWDNRKSEISEWGIILIGLTATPFRGKGSGLDTDRLKRRMGGTYFPTIPYSEELRRYKPHAVVDCQTIAYTKDPIKIIGDNSYDRDGHIEDGDFRWTVTRTAQLKEGEGTLPADAAREDGVVTYDDNAQEGAEDGRGPGEGADGQAADAGGADDDTHDDTHDGGGSGGGPGDGTDTLPTWTYDGQRNIIHEFKKPGYYEVALSVRDSHGNESVTTARITVEPRPTESKMTPEERQKNLYHRLIMRNILCDVYHKVLSSSNYELSTQDVKYMATFGEFRRETIKEIGRDRSRNSMIVREIKRLNGLGKRKILFFGCSVAHSRQIAMLLKVLYRMKVKYVDSKMDLDSRVNAIEQFRSGDLEVLCNFDVLTTGFDAPNIDCVFVGRPVKSTLLYTQMIGRGMRGTKSGGTESMLLVDVDDNFQLRQNYDVVEVELGWKIFKNFWKTWEDPYDGDAGAAAGGGDIGAEKGDAMLAVKRQRARGGRIEDSDVWEDDGDGDEDGDDEDAGLTYACSGCKKEGRGIPEIQSLFGIEGARQLLAECLRSGDHSMLPSECMECRSR
ncbi:MAG: DEAD/DEAH box helicase family protein [Thaumarchaeota archaeon]|nr:DEAD/DEAH box helicase family protein [Nitrososphaerota archaeon]